MYETQNKKRLHPARNGHRRDDHRGSFSSDSSQYPKTLGIVGKKGCKALTKTVDAAILQYRLEYDENPGSTADLINAGLLNEEQTKCDDGQRISIAGGQAVAG